MLRDRATDQAGDVGSRGRAFPASSGGTPLPTVREVQSDGKMGRGCPISGALANYRGEGGFWCRRWELNPHPARRDWILSPARLPIPPLRLGRILPFLGWKRQELKGLGVT